MPMASSKDDERDDEWFKEMYGKEYRGPSNPPNASCHDSSAAKKRSLSQSRELNEDDAPPDPYAFPTDFTSREAKVWEAKAKAQERNWKKKTEEELTCRICGEYGHFTQGCPSTLGTNRKQAEVVERIPVKDKRLKTKISGTGGASIQAIEKKTGCRLKLEDSLTAGNGSFYVRISGSNRVMVRKAAEAVERLLDEVQDDRKLHSHRPHNSHEHGSSAYQLADAQSPHVVNQRMPHDPSVHSHSEHDSSYAGNDRIDRMEHLHQIEARRQWEAGMQNGSSPMDSNGHKGGSKHGDSRGGMKESGILKDQDRRVGMDAFERQALPQTLEELERRFLQETMLLTKELNEAEDQENARHREVLRDIQEQHQQKMLYLRAEQAKHREEFLRHEAHCRQQQYQLHQQPLSQGGSNYYNYESRLLPSYNSGSRGMIGYSQDPGDRMEGYGGYGPLKGHPYGNLGYEPLPRPQAYDLGPYNY